MYDRSQGANSPVFQPGREPSAMPNDQAFLATRHGPVLAGLCADELRERHPRIQAAAAAGDFRGLQAEAHALRGVAANFGLGVLAEDLLALETAARQSDADRLRSLLGRLPDEVAKALTALGQNKP
ncbi:Hpt domain-containing protein [Belnapia rosea]|uniref:Hpt domain-containing protein n=1 Tax=Belnapia rosea TaxID=938405 RepID=A0A1G6PG11_9PROT|nr:Hpt domain-containing protein [Belnapia rosea]SDB54717.1 Hpt domain-containing protein [Belnapia rosea]SDC78387.1 Hpt domain-containing protein [Belnapia rosea]